MTTPIAHRDLIAPLILLVQQAGLIVMGFYESGADVRKKGDASLVTEADECAEAAIVAGLARLTPAIPIVAEEASSKGHTPNVAERFWLVDPLDGTTEFIRHNGEFTVNVALIEAGRAVLGAVMAPALERLYLGAEGMGAFVQDSAGRRPIHCRIPPRGGLTVVTSRSHGDPAPLNEYLVRHRVANHILLGSSLKLCLVAEGKADLYPRLGPTMEWDIAAGHAVLASAGGHIHAIDGSPVTYGKPGFKNPYFVARGFAG